jgi:carboxymethylenebutenolidase
MEGQVLKGSGRREAKTGSERSAARYVAVPAGRPRATVAVLHAWWGLTEVVTGVCDSLAERGYVAVAPDLYGGEVATTAEQAAVLRARRRSTPMWRQIVSAIELARSEHRAPAVGQVGFSMGGHWALWLAKQSRPEIPLISATTAFYATRAGDFSASRSAFQFHLADADPFVSVSGIARQERQLGAAGRPAEFHRYPSTGHWFCEWDRPDAYQPDAARLAWQRTLEFLDRNLPG